MHNGKSGVTRSDVEGKKVCYKISGYSSPKNCFLECLNCPQNQSSLNYSPQLLSGIDNILPLFLKLQAGQ